MSDKKTCYSCKHRGNTPGDAHSSCSVKWLNTIDPMPEGDPHGVRNGWWMFPWNYDPVWMIGECSKFEQK